MWQRIQTLYMVLVIGLMIASILLPNAMFMDTNNHLSYQLDARGLLQIDNVGNPVSTYAINPATYLFGFILFLSTAVIFKYKKRKQQFRLATLNFILILIHVLVLAGFVYYVQQKLQLDFVLQYPIVLPVIALILNFLAMRGIMKDEKLIKSMNRLR